MNLENREAEKRGGSRSTTEFTQPFRANVADVVLALRWQR